MSRSFSALPFIFSYACIMKATKINNTLIKLARSSLSQNLLATGKAQEITRAIFSTVPTPTQTPKCLEPLQIRSITLKNRIAVSPMCQYASEDGFLTDWHFVHLGSRAVGGAGLIFVEGTAISPEGRISPEDLGLWKDEHIPLMQRITKFMKAHDCAPGLQIAHAGRKGSHSAPWRGDKLIPIDHPQGWERIAPSAITFRTEEPPPREITKEEINQVIDDFRVCAQRALACGFEILDIHAANGYLIHQFYSPLSNSRTDEYGGSFTNRIRFLVEIVRAVRSVWPDHLPLFVRISGTDWTEGGWTIKDSVELGKVLKEEKVDLIDFMTGGINPYAKITVFPLYQTEFAEAVKKEAGIMTGAVGMINTPEEVESVIRDGRADLVFMARAFIRDPYLVRRLAEALGAPIPWMDQYKAGGTYAPRK